jgi:hypothetical protein
MARWVPGSSEQPWSWADEEADLLARECMCCPTGIHDGPCDDCCTTPGHYQRSLEEHLAGIGRVEQPVCLGSDGRVWDGHHRIVAARRLGFASVPVEDG